MKFVSDFCISSARTHKTISYDAIFRLRGNPVNGVRAIPDLVQPRVQLSAHRGIWTDCLTPKLSHLPLIFSERVVETILAEDLTGLTFAPVDFVESKGQPIAPPQPYYMVLEIHGAAPSLKYRVFEKVDEEYVFRFETLDKTNDERCKTFYLKDGFIPHIQRMRVVEGEPEDDFMKFPDSRDGMLVFGTFLCSRRFVELAKAGNFSNFSFSPLDRLNWMHRDFRKYAWPPETWYPPYHSSLE